MFTYYGVKALITNSKGKILLLQTDPNKRINPLYIDYWDLPGGLINHGEDLQNALKREMLEETGIDKVKIGKLIGQVIAKIRKPYKNVMAGIKLSVYKCSIQTPAKIQLSDEHKHSKWFNVDEAKILLSYKYNQDFIDLL
jgi:8-oxo-dGTP diphosphatase